MVIRKINTVFSRHGRVIFGLITVVIIIAFMGFMQPGAGFSGFFSRWGWGKKGVYGEIFGKTVTRDEVAESADRELIITDILYNSGLNSYAAANRAQTGAFIGLGLLAAAERRGIRVGDKEISAFIFERAKFRNAETKAFDKKLYASYIDGDLKANGFTAADLDAAVREYLIKDKLLEELRDSVVVTESEIREYYKLLNEKYYVSYGIFDKAQYLGKVKVSLEDAKNYFAGYTPAQEDYIPGKTKILLVAFRYDGPEIKKLVAQELTPKAVRDFYDKNPGLFPDNSKKKAKNGKSVPLPFEKTANKAKEILAARYAKKFASDKAAAFAEAAYDAIGESAEKKQRKVFEELVAEFKNKAVVTDWISDDADKISSSVKEPELVREISISREVPVSNSVVGAEAAYVAFIIDRIVPRPAFFEEIKEKIIAKLKEQEALKTARSQAREFVAKLQKLDKGARLKAVNASKNPEFKMAEPFSLMSQPRMQYAGNIVRTAMGLADGEIASPQRIQEGALVIVLRKRILPAMSGLDKKQKETITNIYKMQKTSIVQNTFYTWLQSKCKRNEQ
ncbi:MAG: SurA N-terminal domain-containing protein [Victivallaceae bacterium]|nr:SurA N-terminal domain-containing protein [Victivallaceae bacterium]